MYPLEGRVHIHNHVHKNNDVQRLCPENCASGPGGMIIASLLSTSTIDPPMLSWLTQSLVGQQNSSPLADQLDGRTSIGDIPDCSVAGQRLYDFAGEMWSRFGRSNALGDFDLVIELLQVSLKYTPGDDAGRPGRLTHLGFLLEKYFELTGTIGALSQAITVRQEVLDLKPEGYGSIDRAELLVNLAKVLVNYSQESGAFDCIERAIGLQQEAVDLTGRDDPRRTARLALLGAFITSRSQQTRNVNDLAKGLEFQQQALDLMPEGHPSRGATMKNLGSFFMFHFQLTGDTGSLSKSIEFQQRVICRPLGRTATAAVELASALRTRFQHTGNCDDLSRAIESQQKALTFAHADSSLEAERLEVLGNLFFDRYQHTGSSEDNEMAIQIEQQVLDSAPDDYDKRSQRIRTLGIRIAHRIQYRSTEGDLLKAIELQQEVLDRVPANSAYRVSPLIAIGACYLNHFRLTQDVESLRKASESQDQALELIPEGHTPPPEALVNLGMCAYCRFERNHAAEDLQKATTFQEKALGISPNDRDFRAQLLEYRGRSAFEQFDRTRNLEDLTRAIQLQQEALDTGSSANAAALRAQRLSSLGLSFHTRYLYTRDLRDIEKAIALQRNAVASKCHTDKCNDLIILGNMVWLRSTDKHDTQPDLKAHDFLGEAIMLLWKALDDLPERDTRRAMVQSNLGTCLRTRFATNSAYDDISKALELEETAIDFDRETGTLDKAGNLENMSLSFRDRSRHQKSSADDLSQSIGLAHRAIALTSEDHENMTRRLFNLGISLTLQFMTTQSTQDCIIARDCFSRAARHRTGVLHLRLYAAHAWAQLSFHLNDEVSIGRAIDVGFEIISLLSRLEHPISVRHQRLREISKFNRTTMSWAIKSAESTPGRALEWIEQNRCLIWTQLSRLRTPLVSLVADPELAAEFSKVSKQLDVLALRSDLPQLEKIAIKQDIMAEQDARRQQQLADEREALLVKIRAIPEFQDFLQPPKMSHILANIPGDGTVILVSCLPERCDAFVLVRGSDAPVHIPLPGFDGEKGKKLADELMEITKSRKNRFLKGTKNGRPVGFIDIISDEDLPVTNSDEPNPPATDTDSAPQLGAILRQLWTEIVWPILEYRGMTAASPPLQDRKRIWWCATGPLAFLPLHAAGIYDARTPDSNRCTSDYAISSYIPTISTLIEKAHSGRGPLRSEARALVVAAPGRGPSEIPSTLKETSTVAQTMAKIGVKTTLLQKEAATVSRVKEEITSHDWVHLSCHGTQHPTDPLKSAFHLYDDPLDLQDLIRQHNSTGEFAFLSACETSVGDSKLHDEAFHLAAGMLAAGYRGAVGTMWTIWDIVDVSNDFYDQLLKEGKGGLDCRKAAHALDYATRKMRNNVKFGDSEEGLLAWVPYIHLGV